MPISSVSPGASSSGSNMETRFPLTVGKTVPPVSATSV